MSSTQLKINPTQLRPRKPKKKKKKKKIMPASHREAPVTRHLDDDDDPDGVDGGDHDEDE